MRAYSHILNGMRLPFFGRAHRGTQTSVVCDVGSAGVAIAVVEAHFGESPFANVLVSERRALGLTETNRSEKQTIDQLQTLMRELATSIIDRHAKSGGATPASIMCIVHGPWLRTETTHAERHFDSPATITANIIADIAKEAVQQNSALAEQDTFERVVTRILLNGYHTKNPEGKIASRAIVSVLQSDINPSMYEALGQALLSVLPGREITYHSALFVQGVIVDEYAPDIAHYTLIDINSTATSAAVIRDGSQLAHATAPIGWRTIIQTLASGDSASADEALSKVRLVAEDACTDAACAQVLDALKKAEPQFVDAYGKMLAELSKELRAPATMLIVAPPDVGGWFVNLFGRIDFAHFTIAEQPFVVEQLFAQYLERGVQFAPSMRPDTGIAAGAALVHISLRDSKR